MSASNYDILGVASDASAEEIRAAWRSSIEDLDPSDRRFAFFNDAAAVLLDDEKRAAYDAELAAGDATGVPTTTHVDGDAADLVGAAEVDDPDGDADSPPEPSDMSGNEPEGGADADALPADAAGPAYAAERGAARWVLLALALATLLIAAVAAGLHFTKTDEEAVETAMAQARTAAEDNVAKLFTYDHVEPEKYHTQAMQVITGDLKAEYDELWRTVIEPNLAATEGSAASEVLSTGLIRASDDGKRVEILVVLASTAGNANVSVPVTLPLTVTMVEVDGQWLIEKSDLWEPDAAEPTDPTDPAEPAAPTPTSPSESPS
ncbi:DnaJ domain-containing protein [Nocardioides sp. AE5]|uniref:J domain-containing protein n=1 Tax=Nocardioides sp. AE5 TaxID=2962573 RepID=UPI002881ACA5|nr:DnaJ domain-containing protein [Nocardioides sp. AE5]MDT0200760.1 DnaJ domain-containing protein [Nocardioides sp. AE5]